MFRKKLVTALVVGAIGVSSLTGCSNAGHELRKAVADEGIETASESKARGVVSKAIQKLKDYDKTYVIATVVGSASNPSQYLEVVKQNKDSYTEYPISSADSSSSSLKKKSSSDNGNSYTLTDWITEDGVYVKSTNGDTPFEKMPVAYKGAIDSRIYMYADELISAGTNFKEDGTQTLDIGNGKEKFTIYKANIPAKAVTDIFGKGSYAVYDSIYKDSDSDANVKALAKYMRKSTKEDLTFSDGSLEIGICDGMAKYVRLDAGGGGNHITMTKGVLTSTKSLKVRNQPDFTNSDSYVDKEVQPTADFCASYDSVEDGVNAINNGAQVPSSDNGNQATSNTQEGGKNE